MRIHRNIASLLTLALLFSTCVGGPSVNQGGQDATREDISALGAIGGVDAFSGPLYEGDGGGDLKLAILAPEAQGGVPGYLPLYIQGLLNNNFKKYSAVTLIDRQNLDKIISEQDIGTSGRFSDTDFVSIGQLTNTQYFLFGTVQKLSGERYSLQLSVTDSVTGIRTANFMKDGTLVVCKGKNFTSLPDIVFSV
ncbi:MAG: CsgG/HfaB family protein [Treponema sp.]|jgi:hypothetical protein|nr:CsgG/HfaB family protein [Treponema sp.]